LPTVSAAEARLAPSTGPLEPDMEPLVRLLEDTPRERLLEVVGARVRRGLSYLQAQGPAEDLLGTARRLILLKGKDPHDYKFSAAVLEDYYHVSPAWRDRFLAASVLQLRGSAEKDNSLIHRIRSAVQG